MDTATVVTQGISLPADGLTAILAVMLIEAVALAKRYLPLMFARRHTNEEERPTNSIPSRINGHPCSMHDELVVEIHEQRTDMQSLRASVEKATNELFPRVNKVEQDLAYMRGRTDHS